MSSHHQEPERMPQQATRSPPSSVIFDYLGVLSIELTEAGGLQSLNVDNFDLYLEILSTSSSVLTTKG